MNAEIISIGDELLIGQTVNTNASWMGQEMSRIGVDVSRVTVISDKEDEIISALEGARDRVDLVLITGGLGPTRDDITKITIAKHFGTKLVENSEVLENVKNRLKARGKELNELNRRQALVPDRARVFMNNWGTAPGMWCDRDNKVVVSMPGVPTEMKGLMKEYVLPAIVEKFSPPVIIHRTILTTGVIEAELADLLKNFEDELPGEIKLAYLPSAPVIKLRLSARGKDRKKLETILDKQEDKLNKTIPDLVFGRETESMEQIVGDMLRKRNMTLSTAESCTGGNISHLITSVPGSSEYYVGSVVAYSNKIKINSLGVDAKVLDNQGAVSKEAVMQMAVGVKRQMETDFSIAVSGIAGPDGGTEDKPVGTVWIGIASERGAYAYRLSLGNDRAANIHMASVISLNLLRKSILKSD